ncbi:MAG: RsmG family class I SAM-dependent methyltransferase [Acidobacteriota bacterium]
MTQLPEIHPQELSDDLSALSPEPLSPESLAALARHYQELRRWSDRLALVGPASSHEVLPRHYGEALAALPLVPRRGVLVDIGSGAGFPGFVLAAARPELRVTLIEARAKKWSFLMAAARAASAALPSLFCQCLNARVGDPLPRGFPETVDCITLRALRLPPEILSLLATRWTATGRFLFWVGAEDPPLPPDLRPGRELPLTGSRSRRVLEVVRAA